jgi:type IV pilus assembly protein PilM
LGTRPRLACEVRAEGVVAARAEDALAVLSAVSRVLLADQIVVPRLRAVDANGEVDNSSAPSGVGGDAAGRAAVVAAVRKALEAVCLRSREITLIVPDAAVRVLLLEFDELPAKLAEALPVVRFRLKKLLPFDADDAAVSYQVMSSAKGLLHVLAVAMPRELLADYELVVREAGFEPGAVLPSTLAALAGLAEGDAPALVINAGREGVTTAIVKAGALLLHRTVDLGADLRADAAAAQLAGNAMQERPANRERSTEEWARQEPVSFIDQNDVAAAIEATALAHEIEAEIALEIAAESSLAKTADEVAQAVSVAAAYFEDTLQTPPPAIHAAGTLGAAALAALLDAAHVGPLAVREMLQPEMLGAGATSAGTPGGVPLGWLAGVRGALAN